MGQDYCEYLLADRGYDSDPFRQALKEKGITPVIPGRKKRLEKVDYDEYTYQERNTVERFLPVLRSIGALPLVTIKPQ